MSVIASIVRRAGVVFVFVLLGLVAVSASAESRNGMAVTFFGNNQIQPTNAEWARDQPGLQLLVINLDEHRNLEKELAEGLPLNDPDRATALARQRTAAVPQSRWDALFVGQMKARQWGVTRFPAVVFGDGDSVVYGVTDLQDAIERWQAAGGVLP